MAECDDRQQLLAHRAAGQKVAHDRIHVRTADDLTQFLSRFSLDGLL